MPKPIRVRIKKLYDQADNDLDRCLINLQKLENVYETGYPKQHSMIVLVAQAVVQTQTLLKRVRSELS